MNAKRPFGRSMGVETYYAEEDGRIVLHSVQPDVTPLLEQNAAIRNGSNGRHGGTTMVAQIPVTLFYDFIKRGLIPRGSMGEQIAAIKAKVLSDSDYAKLRTTSRRM